MIDGGWIETIFFIRFHSFLFGTFQIHPSLITLSSCTLFQNVLLRVFIDILIDNLHAIIGNIIPINRSQKRPRDILDGFLFTSLILTSQIGKYLEEDVIVIFINLDVVHHRIADHVDVFAGITNHIDHEIARTLIIGSFQLNLQIAGGNPEIWHVSMNTGTIGVIRILVIVVISIGRW